MLDLHNLIIKLSSFLLMCVYHFPMGNNRAAEFWGAGVA
jgi:hypothetical protein